MAILHNRLDHWSHKWKYDGDVSDPEGFTCAKCGCVSTSRVAMSPCPKSKFGVWSWEFSKNWGTLTRALIPVLTGCLIGSLTVLAVALITR
jgi:hypothetical protein